MIVRGNFKILGITIALIFSLPVFAEGSIRVNVHTADNEVSALGYTVQGKKSGGPGKSYSGTGPANKTYKFGYRKHSAQGANISCGSHTLTKDSNVTLVTKGSHCTSLIN